MRGISKRRKVSTVPCAKEVLGKMKTEWRTLDLVMSRSSEILTRAVSGDCRGQGSGCKRITMDQKVNGRWEVDWQIEKGEIAS